MRWDERQVAMLRAMGIRLWQPIADADEPIAVAEVPAAAPPMARQGAAVPAASAQVGRPALEPAAPAQVGRPAAVPATPAAAPKVVMVPSLDIAVRDWPGLRQAVADCTACSLHAGRTQTVFGVGNESADWMIVGEAPGEQEDREGEPFVGKSGQLLDQMLRAIGLTRAEGEPARQVYIANTLKCRPPGNRNPAPEELAKCEPFLVRQIEWVQPRIILAMGRFAVQALLRSAEPIGRLRGKVHQYHGVPLVVTYHPAYLLRNPEDKAKAWDDLCLALATVNRP